MIFTSVQNESKTNTVKFLGIVNLNIKKQVPNLFCKKTVVKNLYYSNKVIFKKLSRLLSLLL